MLRIEEVKSNRDQDRFIELPGKLANDDPCWIEPLHIERRQFLDTKKNPFFEHATVRHWLAYDGAEIVGRISAVVDQLAPAVDGMRLGFFGLVDARQDEVLHLLTETAESWLRSQDCALTRGPFSLSVNQTSGLLVEGFSTPPYLMMDHHSPWLGSAIERQGYAKARDLVAYELFVRDGLANKPRRLAMREWPGLEVRSLDMRRYRDEIITVTSIFNDAWSDNWGFIPLTEAEIDAMASELKPILDPELVKIAEIDGEPVAFIVFLPNINEAIADLGGKLLPFGWIKLLWRLKFQGLKTGRVPLMGVKRDISQSLIGKTLPLRLIYALEERGMARGVERIELSWLLEDNWPVRRLIESIGGAHTKTYRIYEKRIA